MFSLTPPNQERRLITALQQRQGLPTIQVIVMFNPQLVQVRGDNGLTSVHYAICLSPPEVVGYLTETWPQSLAIKEESGGCLPMHFAAEVSPIDVVKYIAEKWEPALQVKTNDGWLPLHVAAQSATQPLAVFQYLVQKYEAALDATSNRGHLPLHYAASKASAEVVQYLVQQRPQSLLVEDCDGDLPLHCAAEAAAQLPVIRCLVDKDKRALRERNVKGRLPLHVAAEHAPLEVVKFLVEQDRTALQSTDHEGFLPLHVAAKHSSYPLVKYLATEWSGALTAKNLQGQRPVDLAKQRDDDDSKAAVTNWLEGATRQEESKQEPAGSPVPVQEREPKQGADRRTVSVQESDVPVRGSEVRVVDDGIQVHGSSTKVPGRDTRIEEDEIDLRVWGSSNRADRPQVYVPAPSPADPHQHDRDRVRSVIELASLEPVAVSGEYVQSILTAKFIGEGFFGTVYKGRDPILGREFAIKSINTEILRGGSKQDLDEAMKTFKTEQEVRASTHCVELTCVRHMRYETHFVAYAGFVSLPTPQHCSAVRIHRPHRRRRHRRLPPRVRASRERVVGSFLQRRLGSDFNDGCKWRSTC